jgi:hypothetical protein
MKNLLLVLGIMLAVTFAVNAQSSEKECCATKKGETIRIEKSINSDQTMKSTEKLETTKTTMANDKKIVEKEVVVTKTKIDKNESCRDKTSCCKDGKKDKQIEKEVEKN